MAVISIEKISETWKYNRLDAKFYQPQYFIEFSKGNWKPIKRFLDICQYGISQAMTEEPIGYPIFRMDDIKDGFLLDDEVKYLEIPEQIFKQFKLETNDILFNRVNAEEFVGRTGISKLKGDYVFASYLIRLRIKPNSEILPDYLNIFLNTKFGKKQIHRFSRRAVNQANVNAEELKNFKICIIPLESQEQICQLSNEAWDKIELSKSLYSQAESLLLEELGLKDFKPKYELSYTANLSEAFNVHRIDAEYFQPAYHKLIERLKSNLNTKPLKVFLFDFQKGIEVGSENYQEEGKPFIRVSNLSIHGFVERDQKYIDEELYQTLRDTYEPKVGDFLLTKDATPGIAYVVKEPVEGVIASGILKLKINEDEINKEYLALCINSMVGRLQIERDGGGSVITHWRPERIKNLLIPILPPEIQQKIASLVQQSHEARRKAKELLEEAKRKVKEAIENEIKK